MIDNAAELKPVFIFSLPRSGSTLLQRILAAHDSITTASEPWILLPLVYSLRDQGIYTEYRQTTAMSAIRDFINLMPNGTDDYREELQNFTTRLYARTINTPAKYFVDKTPRYHLIIDDIVELFPNGKFIFMWRNPLGMLASMVQQFWNGRWKLHLSQVDLYDGVLNLVNAFVKHQPQVCSIQFEDLLQSPEPTWETIFDYLELSSNYQVLSSFNKVALKGRYGDKLGVEKYQSLSTEPLTKWKQTLNTPIRKYWCRRYLTWIGKRRLGVMGYNINTLLTELDQIPLRCHHIPRDIFEICWGTIYRFIEPRIYRHKFSLLSNSNLIHTHT